MDTKQLTKYAQKNGLTIAIGHPSEYCSSLSELKIMIDEELSNISGQS